MTEQTFTQEKVRFFLEELEGEMRRKYSAQLPAALVLFDAIMEPGPRCEASKDVFKQWFNNLFHFSVAQTVLERGREFAGVDIIKPEPMTDEEEEDRKKDEAKGFYG